MNTESQSALCTDAWLLYKGIKTDNSPQIADLIRHTYHVETLDSDEVLIEPIYGCWEGNMTHALQRKPVDICRFRREDKVVLGNSGVVRVLKTGTEVNIFKEGQLCIIFGNAMPDSAGYMIKALAYDAPNTMGLLAKRSKVKSHNLIPLPKNTQFSLPQWAAFSLRYITAWSNWRVAWTVYRAHMSEIDRPSPVVAAWGGGVAFAQLQLAQHFNCKTLMFASRDSRIHSLTSHGINPIDRRNFPDIDFHSERYKNDLAYKLRYKRSEKTMLSEISKIAKQNTVDLFFDHIGGPLINATLKATGRQGVISSAGWKLGSDIAEISRSTECMQRRTHVNTHYAKYQEGLDAVEFAEKNNWIPPNDLPVYSWEEIPTLAKQYAANEIDSYFPIYRINEE